MTTDLTNYGDSELSMHVFNDETLYNMRHRSSLIPLLDEIFTYTPDQLAELETDLADDLEELENE